MTLTLDPITHTYRELPVWTTLTPAEKQSAIRPLWADGKSASEIAAHFIGATRNSIISALHRGKMVGRTARPNSTHVGASSRMTKVMNEQQRKLKLKTAPKPKPKPMQYIAPFTQIPDAEPVPASVMDMIANNRPPLAGTTPVGILDLPNRPGVLCRFPVIGGYCGVQCGDKAYCPDHHAIMYRETDKLRMPKEARL